MLIVNKFNSRIMTEECDLGGVPGAYMTDGEPCDCKATVDIYYNGVRCCPFRWYRGKHRSVEIVIDGSVFRAESDSGWLTWCHWRDIDDYRTAQT